MCFDKNDRQAIEEALRDPNPENPIAQAVAERVAEFAASIATLAEEQQKFPSELLLAKPETAFDDIVIRLTVQAIADESGIDLQIVWV